MASKRKTTVQLSKELATDLFEASLKVNEVVETIEVQLDREAVRRLKTGEREYRSGKYKIAKNKDEIEKVLSA